MTTIYKKVGRRYKEIGRCDPEASYYPHGAHLVVCRKNSTLTMYGVDPAWGPIEAALVLLAEAMSDAMRKATELMPEKRPYTAKEKAGLAAYEAIAGRPVGLQYEGASMHDVIQAGIEVLRKELG